MAGKHTAMECVECSLKKGNCEAFALLTFSFPGASAL